MTKQKFKVEIERFIENQKLKPFGEYMIPDFEERSCMFWIWLPSIFTPEVKDDVLEWLSNIGIPNRDVEDIGGLSHPMIKVEGFWESEEVA